MLRSLTKGQKALALIRIAAFTRQGLRIDLP